MSHLGYNLAAMLLIILVSSGYFRRTTASIEVGLKYTAQAKDDGSRMRLTIPLFYLTS